MMTTLLPQTKMQDQIAVLVADDDPAVRTTVSEVLVNGGFEVVAGCEDDRSAIEAARKYQPDVALIDVRMPGGGPRATREIRMVSPKTFVLGYSAFEDLPGVLEMIRAGAIGYVVKDSDPAKLRQSVTRAAAGESVLSPGITRSVVSELSNWLNRSNEIAEEWAALNLNKEELIQVLAHELRTPLTIIQGVVGTLADRDCDELMRKSLLSSITQAAERIGRLSHNVATVASFDRHSSLPTAARGAEAPERVLAKSVAELDDPDGRVKIRHSPTMPLVAATADSLSGAILEVLQNAIALSVDDVEIEMSASVDRRMVEFNISDRGPGIPDSKKEPVFESFFQVDSSTTRSHPGVGIGLYLARRIVRAHGGEIFVQDRAGGGSTFVIQVPVENMTGD